jgi:hypothetical protein
MPPVLAPHIVLVPSFVLTPFAPLFSALFALFMALPAGTVPVALSLSWACVRQLA